MSFCSFSGTAGSTGGSSSSPSDSSLCLFHKGILNAVAVTIGKLYEFLEEKKKKKKKKKKNVVKRM